jgi:hypothetical protein
LLSKYACHVCEEMLDIDFLVLVFAADFFAILSPCFLI